MQTNTIDPEQTRAGEAGEDEYLVSEIFYSVQGEGVQTGVPMVFIRFAGCNLRCRREQVGFDCDTDFQSGRAMTAREVAEAVIELCPDPWWVMLTGGEPGLQADRELLEAIDKAAKCPGFAFETNGTVDIDHLVKPGDHICLSPKSAWHTIRQREADELKMVRAPGQDLPEIDDIPVEADHYVVSPRFEPDGSLARETLDHCLGLVKDNPRWRLSLQTHKFLGAR